MDYTFDKPQMPISSMELYKVAEARLLLTLRHPTDEKTSNAGTQERRGMVYKASRGTFQK